MKMFITGSNGFIGKNLVEYFQPKHDVFFPKRQELDLLDKTAVKNYIATHKFDLIIHCAINITSVEQNLKMYYNIERCSAFFDKFFNIGSGSEYDIANYIPKMKERYFNKYLPSDTYGFSKYVIARDIEAKHRNIYNFRVFGIFGKYEDYRRRFISNNICRALCGKPISINKNMYFDYLYIYDFCRLFEIILEKNLKYRSYNLCRGETCDLLSIAKFIQEIDGKDLDIIIKEPGEKPEYSGDNSLIMSEIDNFIFTDIKYAIKELYQWYKNEKIVLSDIY